MYSVYSALRCHACLELDRSYRLVTPVSLGQETEPACEAELHELGAEVA